MFRMMSIATWTSCFKSAGQYNRHGACLVEQWHGHGLRDQAWRQVDRRGWGLHSGEPCESFSIHSNYLNILGINPLPLKSGSTTLHLLLWAEKTTNMQYVPQRWVNMNWILHQTSSVYYSVMKSNHLSTSVRQHGWIVPQLRLGHCRELPRQAGFLFLSWRRT